MDIWGNIHVSLRSTRFLRFVNTPTTTAKNRTVPNMAMHPTVSRVTPPAKSGKRRAARPAGDGPRWADK